MKLLKNLGLYLLPVLMSACVIEHIWYDTDETTFNSTLNDTVTMITENTIDEFCDLKNKDSNDCDSDLICIGYGEPDWLGKCVKSCIDECSEGNCTDWTAISNPQLPSKMGVCI